MIIGLFILNRKSFIHNPLILKQEKSVTSAKAKILLGHVELCVLRRFIFNFVVSYTRGIRAKKILLVLRTYNCFHWVLLTKCIAWLDNLWWRCLVIQGGQVVLSRPSGVVVLEKFSKMRVINPRAILVIIGTILDGTLSRIWNDQWISWVWVSSPWGETQMINIWVRLYLEGLVY